MPETEQPPTQHICPTCSFSFPGPLPPSGPGECKYCHLRGEPDLSQRRIASLRARAQAEHRSYYRAERLTHELKTWPDYYDAIARGLKTFEIRQNDRGYKVGDVLFLREWNPHTRTYTGRNCRRRITYLTDFEQQPGFLVLALARSNDSSFFDSRRPD